MDRINTLHMAKQVVSVFWSQESFPCVGHYEDYRIYEHQSHTYVEIKSRV